MHRPTRPGPQAAKQQPQPRVMVPRLPPGSAKLHVWDGQVWIGTLKVLDSPDFVARSPSESKNLHALDRLFRLWLEEQNDVHEALER